MSPATAAEAAAAANLDNTLHEVEAAAGTHKNALTTSRKSHSQIIPIRHTHIAQGTLLLLV